MPAPDVFAEAQRQLTICNACRYCEGYCAVFPAMELRRELTAGDVVFLAHLCHDCRACYYACMYTPPHEFAVNVPRVLTQVRQATYARYAWPGVLSRIVQQARLSRGVGVLAATVVAVLTVLLAGSARLFSPHRGPGAFYEVVSYEVIIVAGLALALYGVAVWAAGGRRFWRETGTFPPGSVSGWALAAAAWDAATLRWLRGGGPGCPYPRERASTGRRILHSLVFYGFFAALASTTLAAIYQDLLHRLPPYPLMSAPVVLGTVGGVAMIAGSAGLLLLKARIDAAPAESGMVALDYSFLVILGLASLTGLLTLALRDTAAMGTVLTIHLGLVAALFVTAPYGKFVHAVYRYLALVRNRIEQRGIRASDHP